MVKVITKVDNNFKRVNMLLNIFFLQFFILVLYFIKLKHDNLCFLQATVLDLGENLFTHKNLTLKI